MEKEFVTYEIALELKELGFDEPCIRGWYEDGGIWYHPDSDIVLDNPTFSQAFRFFREKYNLHITISHNQYWVFEIYTTSNDTLLYGESTHKSYEEAELECLKKLIEIVKGK